MNELLAQRLRFSKNLPTPPATAVRLIDLVNDPDVGLTQIADCVAADPALSAKLLKVANSPLYSSRRRAQNLRQAVNILGMHTAATVALSFSLIRNFNDGGSGSLPGEYWKRAVLSGLACRVLAGRFGLDPDDLFAAGLLQDIGILALHTSLPQDYADLLDITNQEELLLAEKKKFGAGHDEVGHWLLQRWRLPEHLGMACLKSHTAPAPGGNAITPVHCVAASAYLANVFLDADMQAAHRSAAERAVRHWLNMDEEALASILEEIGQNVQEVERLFDLPLVESAHLEALAEEAKELIAIAGLGKLRDLEEKSRRDALTGAHNRLYFDEAFRQEFAVSTRHGWPLSLAFIDIDHFKRINDTYGHAAGDNALVGLSRLISSQIRAGDIFARYGGEEFVLLLPGTEVAAAEIVLSRIREQVEAVSHTFNTDTAQITISVGLASHNEGPHRYETAEEMMRAADQALYAAKHSGRNQLARAPAVHVPAL